jgi:membrane fusion protein (multidrug efflux system)
VVGTDDKVSTKTVKVGERVGGRWVVDQGLEAGTRVVVEGAATRDGTVVHPSTYVDAAEAR